MIKKIKNNDKYKDRYTRLGLNIAYYRKLRGLTQLDLAEAVDISRTHMSNIEAPNIPTSVSIELLFDISDELGIPTKLLFDFEK